jgi:hypothetical protein
MSLQDAVERLIDGLPFGSAASRFTVQGQTVEFSIADADGHIEKRLSVVYLNAKGYPESGIAILAGIADNNSQADNKLESCRVMAERIFSVVAPIENVVNEVIRGPVQLFTWAI